MGRVLAELRVAIEKSGQSRYEISKGSGVSESQLSRFVRGQAGLSMDNAELIATYLGYELRLRRAGQRKGAR